MSKPCQVVGCEEERWARGYCNGHYNRWRDGKRGGALIAPMGGRDRECVVPWCRDKAWQRNYHCNKHERRMQKHDSPIHGESVCKGCGSSFKYAVDEAGAPKICNGCRYRSCEECGDLVVIRQISDGGERYCSDHCRQRGHRTYTECENCGAEFWDWSVPNQTYCSLECARSDIYSSWQNGELEDKTCPQCGENFTPNHPAQTYCTPCYKLRIRRSRAKASARRRARLKQREIEDFDRVDIYERDGWVCQICGESVDRQFENDFDPWRPSIDHIMPIARGGDHTKENVQTAHLRCNLKKSSKLPSSAID